ncbi:NAD(P) transhydrogenase subunit alpha [Marinibaculum pumilum]|uniref:proton-translocating NAD(P)(+) transhydrogenase n=1 Tax=Marinibaculum pumilum TaxID=1766165 RepID=A0ABV7L7L5_9PROT
MSDAATRAVEAAERAAAIAQAAASRAAEAAGEAMQAAEAAGAVATGAAHAVGVDPFVFRLAIFVLAIFVGYYVVWSVTPALHTPLMAVTNAISSVIIVGALIAAGPADYSISKIFGIIAIALAAVNIFGGFAVTQRMLAMYKKKKK